MIKQHIQSLLLKGLREDGRKLEEYRKPITVERGISPRSAEGSARVKIGETDVIAGVKLEVGEPYPDTPNQGNLIVNVEFRPFANPEFESGPPGVAEIELSRVIDRAIRESECIDLKKLCIKDGEKAWVVLVDIYPVNDDGNLFDACYLAALSALLDAKFPEFEDDKKCKILYDKKTNKSLPIKNFPLSCTVIKISDKLLVDPSEREWNALDARLTVALTQDGKICAI